MTSSKEVREIAMKIIKAEIFMVNLEPKVKRVDAIQSFISQETPIVRLDHSKWSGWGGIYLHHRHGRLFRYCLA